MNQHITYNEWLPIILGETVLDIFELRLLQSGYAKVKRNLWRPVGSVSGP